MAISIEQEKTFISSQQQQPTSSQVSIIILSISKTLDLMSRRVLQDFAYINPALSFCMFSYSLSQMSEDDVHT